jgi:3-oxoacyl-(acyl-carrier-protein) synthase
MFPEVLVTGTGVVSCAGLGVNALMELALHSRTAVIDGLGAISSQVIGEIKKHYPECAEFSPAAIFAYAAIRGAMREAGWTKLNDDDGLILGTTTGQISLWEGELIQYLKGEMSIEKFADHFRHQSMGLIIDVLSHVLNFNGKTLLLTSACSASTQAIGMGSLWIKNGTVKRCLVGGTEVLSRLTVEGFRSLQLLSNEACRPFDQNRSGINLSEGAGFLTLEAHDQNAVYPKTSRAFISGFGFSTDAYHMASPQPEGKGSLKAMSLALAAAELKPEAVSWVHAHGTGSKANDQAEGHAVKDLFAGVKAPPVTSTKWIHGHALAASGTIETILCIEAMKKNLILKTDGLSEIDPEIRVNHPAEILRGPVQHVLKNTLGFGGNNAALVISNLKEGSAL